MPVIEFGTGLLYGTPNAGNLPAFPTPVRLLLQEVSVEFKGDLKKLYTTSQFPIATARGKIDVAGKAKIVNYDPDPINQLFWAQTTTVGMQIIVDQEIQTIPASAPFTIVVTAGTNWAQDNGVSYNSGTASGQIMLSNTTAASKGYYSATSNGTSGTYTFNSQDNNTAVAISYSYTNSTRGKTIALANQVMGYAPVCSMDVWGTFRNKILGIRLNACTLGSWTYPSKLEDFWVSDVAFDANLDNSNNLGKIFADVF